MNSTKVIHYKPKIIYKVYDEIPSEVKEIQKNDDEDTKSYKY